jgi:hypothetical protein
MGTMTHRWENLKGLALEMALKIYKAEKNTFSVCAGNFQKRRGCQRCYLKIPGGVFFARAILSTP